MQLKDIMTRNPEVMDPGTSIMEAARKMASLNVGFLPVGDSNKIIGVITDRDIALRAVAEGKDTRETPVQEVMTRQVESLPQDAGIEEAARLMESNQIRRIVVTGAKGKCVGVVSLGDMCLRIRDEHLSSEILGKVSEPEHATA